jgi:hypothetical protein
MFMMGKNITGTVYCNHGIAVKLDTLGAWFVPGI